jgi:hypothetical protein
MVRLQVLPKVAPYGNQRKDLEDYGMGSASFQPMIQGVVGLNFFCAPGSCPEGDMAF